MSRYNAKAVETKWQAVWTEQQAFRAEADPKRPKYYVLEMFPYPSGRIHMGHVRNYTLGDVVARYKRARGFNVLHPMGWDAFGLPAENAAQEKKVHPAAWTYDNIANMRAELKRMGLSLDWSKELATCHPGYYAQQQRIFLDFFKAGLAYRKEAFVNWDPIDHTVLANEQVIDGKGWRSGAPVEKRKLSQWFLKITEYADDLLSALGSLDRWPEKVRLMQENWIGKSTGAHVRFKLAGRADRVEVFTTRPDPLFGASFIAVSPDHALADAAAKADPKVAAFIAECRAAGTSEAAVEAQEKRGYKLDIEAEHPLMPGKRLPVYIANFVLIEYGTGAIFGCPSGDQRDLDFARKYGLPVVPVVLPAGEDPKTFAIGDTAYTDDGTIFNSGFLDGLDVETAKKKVGQVLKDQGWTAASVIGAVRFRSSIVTRAAQYRSRTRTCRCCCPTTSPLRSPAIRSTTTRPGSMSIARLAARPQGARPIRSTPLSIHPGISRASARRAMPIRSTKTRSITGWRSTNISVASSMPFCTSSIRVSSPAP